MVQEGGRSGVRRTQIAKCRYSIVMRENASEERRSPKLQTTKWMEHLQQVGESYLGRTIPSFFILASRVVGLTPRISAAPRFPRMRQPVACSTLRKYSDSTSSIWRMSRLDFCSSSGTSPRKVDPVFRIRFRSMTFRSSRTFPGHEYLWNSCIVEACTTSMLRPMRWPRSSRMCHTRAGMSSGRSRNGGMTIGKH